ncbi:MAG TPA: adenine phosphoribosyltransferase [Rubricoccaceae bacterium]
MPDSVLAAIRTVADFPAPGVAFKDLTPVLADPALFAEALERLAAPWVTAGVTHVVGVEARGFWFGPALAARLGAGFVPARKPGKLPTGPGSPGVRSASYALEYGTDAVELLADALGPGARVLVHDDVLATGGTAQAVCALVAAMGASLAGVSVVLEIAVLGGRSRLPARMPVEAVLAV